MAEGEKLEGLARLCAADTESVGIGGAITMESLQAAMDSIRKRCRTPPPPMVRYVSHQRYAAAERAEATGASRLEIEWILQGASPEQAKQMAGGR